MGFCKVKKFKFLIGNPSLTWTEHSNHNHQQLLAMYLYTDRIHMYGILLQNISTGLGLFWDEFPKQNKIPSKTWTHPPTSIVISDFWRKKILCKALDVYSGQSEVHYHQEIAAMNTSWPFFAQRELTKVNAANRVTTR